MERWYRALRTCAPAECARIQQACSAIWDDVSCFPVDRNQVQFENSWMFERTYGGLRGHEGTDLIPEENISGYYPVRSMTDGVVEQIGWLELGGYRIGIRSTSGGYFYYAHLSGYADSFACGDEIEAGELLGYMGDTGYGPEGTTGQFPVHLHLGIYIATETKEEISVNPYWVLRYCIFTMNMLQ
jgi:murein DD-endopeptidase MepM/ murein hydrolase activator NlpD